MVADTVVVDVLVYLFLPGELFSDFEGFPDGTGVGTTTANVLDLGDSWGFEKFLDEARHVMGVNVVTDLLALVTKDLVFPAL